MLRYARCPFTDGFMSNFTKSVGNFETQVKSASYVIHPPEQEESRQMASTQDARS